MSTECSWGFALPDGRGGGGGLLRPSVYSRLWNKKQIMDRCALTRDSGTWEAGASGR